MLLLGEGLRGRSVRNKGLMTHSGPFQSLLERVLERLDMKQRRQRYPWQWMWKLRVSKISYGRGGERHIAVARRI